MTTSPITNYKVKICLVMSEAQLQAGANIIIWRRSQESIDKALEHLNNIDGTENKVKGAIIKLTSMASGFVTDVSIPVDGGYLTPNI